MTRAIGLVVSVLLAVASVAFLFVSVGARSQARGTLEGAERLYAARVDVTEAEEALGDSDLTDAIAAARGANETAGKVRSITTEIADLLSSAERAASATSATSRKAVKNVSVTRRQTAVTGDLLAVIAGYQRAASGFADTTNAALKRILEAVRATNRSFPGP